MIELLALLGLPPLSLSVLALQPLAEYNKGTGCYWQSDGGYRIADPAEGRNRGFVKPRKVAFGAATKRRHV